MNWYLVFCRKVNRTAMFLSVLCLLATVVICFMQVLTRTAANFSYRWTEEVTRYVIIFAVFLASGTLLANDEHPRVEIFCSFLSKKGQLYLNYFYYILIGAFVLLLCYYGWQLSATSTRTYCSSIRIPWAVPFSAVFIGGLNMLVQIPGKFIKNRLDIIALAHEEKKEGSKP